MRTAACFWQTASWAGEDSCFAPADPHCRWGALPRGDSPRDRPFGLEDFRVKEKELLDRAGRMLRIKPNALMQRVTDLGRSVGSPWSQDEKFATLAAWLALAAPSER